MASLLRNGLFFLTAVFLHFYSSYSCFGILSSLGYANKTNSFIFKTLEVIGQLLWLPLGVLQYTKFWFILEWNYPIILIVNSLIAIGIIFVFIFVRKPLWGKLMAIIVSIFLLWVIFLVLGYIFVQKK